MAPRAANERKNYQSTASINEIFVKHIMNLQIACTKTTTRRVERYLVKFIAF